MDVDNMEAIETARSYYNSDDAEAFYSTVWGGENIHVGIYNSEYDSVFFASRRTVERMASHLNLSKDSRVLDLGSGYCGAARYLAKTYGCNVVALNLSEVENERARQLNREQGFDKRIKVVDGNFEQLPYKKDAFDVIWSQDAFLHSPEREDVVKEAARVMKRGSSFVFTDPMKSDDCPDGVLQPILDRIHLESMASPGFYREVASENGLEEIGFDDLTVHLVRHYDHIRKDTEENEVLLKREVSSEYISNMKKGLQHWVDGGQNGYLCWGIFHFQKN